MQTQHISITLIKKVMFNIHCAQNNIIWEKR